MQVIPIRLNPNQLLKEEIERKASQLKVAAGFVICGIGSLKSVSVRLAESKTVLKKDAYFEVLSLQGSISLDGSHLHILLADSAGNSLGGHLMPGCVIHTTAEILLVTIDNFQFKRELDSLTGYKELKIDKK